MEQYELQLNGETIFSHTHFNACIGQAKYFYRRKGLRGSFCIFDNLNRVISCINEESLKEAE